MSSRTKWYTDNSGPATLATSGAVAIDLGRGDCNMDRSVRVPADEAIKCPQCDAEGWMSARAGAFDGLCGSRWFELGGIETSRQCLLLEHRLDAIDERDYRISELERMLADLMVVAA